jgi:hypothetical protein
MASSTVSPDDTILSEDIITIMLLGEILTLIDKMKEAIRAYDEHTNTGEFFILSESLQHAHNYGNSIFQSWVLRKDEG